MDNIADLVVRSATAAAEVASVAGEMQRQSESLRVDIPNIVRKGTRADMRECMRYDVDMTALVEVNGRSFRARIHDISESGIRIEKRLELVVGAKMVVTFDGFHPVSGHVVRVHDDTVGACFEPQRLKIEEVRRLVTAVAA